METSLGCGHRCTEIQSNMGVCGGFCPYVQTTNEAEDWLLLLSWIARKCTFVWQRFAPLRWWSYPLFMKQRDHWNAKVACIFFYLIQSLLKMNVGRQPRCVHFTWSRAVTVKSPHVSGFLVNLQRQNIIACPEAQIYESIPRKTNMDTKNCHI